MRLFALELDNDIKGIEKRKAYLEKLIASLEDPDFVVLPELSLCSYMASNKIFEYADEKGKDTSAWSLEMAKKYNTYIGVGYLDLDGEDFYNRYMITSPDGVCGCISKSEGETAVFKNGDFDSIISTPLGNIAVAICYDAKRKHFYNNIHDEKISMILFPHGCPADPNKPKEEEKTNDYFCGCYKKAFNVPVVYVNSVGSLEYMPGTMGKLMAKAGFKMNGKSKIYADGKIIETNIPEAIGMEVSLSQNSLIHEIRFYKDDIINGNWLFRKFILEPDKKNGLKMYKKDKTHYIKSR